MHIGHFPDTLFNISNKTYQMQTEPVQENTHFLGNRESIINKFEHMLFIGGKDINEKGNLTDELFHDTIQLVQMWSNNRFLDDLKNHCQKAKTQKINHKELDSILITIESCLNSNLQATQYQKIMFYFIQIFVASLHLLPHDGLYRCFRGVIQCAANQSKTQKAYLLIKNVVEVSEKVFKTPQRRSQVFEKQKQLKLVLSLVKKSGQKQFGAQVVNMFLNYYLERLQKQIQEKKQTKLGNYILSDLANILLTRYKNHSLLVVKKQIISVTSLAPLFVIIEYQYNQSFMNLVLESIKQPLSYSSFFKAQPNIDIEYFLYSKMLFNFVICLRDNLCSLLLNLHNLLPIQGKNLLNPQLFVDQIYLDTFLNGSGIFVLLSNNHKIGNTQEWNHAKHKFITHFWHQCYDEKKLINAEYYWKLTILFIAVFCPYVVTSQQLEKQIKDFQTHKNPSQQEQSNSDIIEDSISMLNEYLKAKKNQYFNQNPHPSKYSIEPNFGLLKLYQEKIGFKSKLKQCGKDFEAPLNLQNWKMFIICMFEALQEQQDHKQQIQESQRGSYYLQSDSYNQTALFGLNYFGIRTPTLQKQYTAKLDQKSRQNKLFRTSNLTKNCLEVLEKIIIHINCEQVPEKLISHVKKVMSYVFNKVTENVIKSRISNNLFYSKCLLLTNHSGKCKILFEDIMKKGWMMPEQQFRRQLTQLLVLPQNVVMQYGRFLSTRDKLKFRMQLYQLDLTHLDYLTDISVADLITNQ